MLIFDACITFDSMLNYAIIWQLKGMVTLQMGQTRKTLANFTCYDENLVLSSQTNFLKFRYVFNQPTF